MLQSGAIIIHFVLTSKKVTSKSCPKKESSFAEDPVSSNVTGSPLYLTPTVRPPETLTVVLYPAGPLIKTPLIISARWTAALSAGRGTFDPQSGSVGRVSSDWLVTGLSPWLQQRRPSEQASEVSHPLNAGQHDRAAGGGQLQQPLASAVVCVGMSASSIVYANMAVPFVSIPGTKHQSPWF